MRKIISASAAIIEDKKILLCKRSKKETRFPEHWTFPGGKLEDNPELLSEVVKREVKEEINLDFEPKEKLGFYEMIKDDYHNMSHVFLGSFSGDIQIDNDEVVEYGWFTYEETKKLDIAFSYSESIQDLHDNNII